MAARFFITDTGKSLSLICSSIVSGVEDWEMRLEDVTPNWNLTFMSRGSKYIATTKLDNNLRNQWVNAIITIDGTSCKMYLKAKSGTPYTIDESVAVPTDRAQTATSAQIGSTLSSLALLGAHATAIIRDVKVWMYAISNTERDEWIAEGNPRDWDQILDLPLDETSGTAATDYADNHMVMI